MSKSQGERRAPFSRFRGRIAQKDRGAPLKDYTVLLGLLTVGSVLLVHSIGARITEAWHALVGQMSATAP